MTDGDAPLHAIRLIAENRKGVLRDIAAVVADHGANILMIHQETFETGPLAGRGELYFEYEDDSVDHGQLIADLCRVPYVLSATTCDPFSMIYGSRVIIIGGGAQVD